MDDDPERPGAAATLPMINRVGDEFRAADHSSDPGEDPEVPGEDPEVITLHEETVAVAKRRILTGAVRVETRTELRHENAEVDLERDVVDVTRVPVNRLIEETPTVRTEGDITIVPIVEERFVVLKQLFLREELHIRHRTEREIVHQAVALRRQHAVVLRLDPNGRTIDPCEEPSPKPVVEALIPPPEKAASIKKVQDLVAALAEAAKRLRRR